MTRFVAIVASVIPLTLFSPTLVSLVSRHVARKISTYKLSKSIFALTSFMTIIITSITSIEERSNILSYFIPTFKYFMT